MGEVRVYAVGQDSAMRQEESLPFGTTFMELAGITLSEVSQRRTETVRSYLYVESKKNQTHRYREQISGCQRQWVGGGGNV